MKQINRKLIKIINNKPDKFRTVIAIDTDSYQQKVKPFEQENHFTKICKDSTDFYQKQI